MHLRSACGVSRETSARLDTYAALLRKWTPKINLIAKSTLRELESRHFEDSAQILNVADPKATSWIDLGSGGGFPGLVVAILAMEMRPDLHVTLVESDRRKSAFLSTVVRETRCRATVLSKRVEELPDVQADILSARALSDLSTLFSLSSRLLSPNGHMLFLKGSNWKKEVEEAEKSWQFDYETYPSLTDPNAVILKTGASVHV